MAAYNKILLIGNLTRDPQLSYTPSQTPVVDFGLATNRKWTGQDGTQREETCFVDCRSFGRQAETMNKYLTKGSPVFIEGRLTFDSWTAQDGSKRSKHRVTVETFQFLRGQGGQEERPSGYETQAAAPDVESAPASAAPMSTPSAPPAVPAPEAAPAPQTPPAGIPEDEIPF
ncbi:MAG: single-stranded DNA-binding protein [Planctomycetes bacterium]|nr:single-stranded DNA-binding protein [Planctomycetota bacterium]